MLLPCCDSCCWRMISSHLSGVFAPLSPYFWESWWLVVSATAWPRNVGTRIKHFPRPNATHVLEFLTARA